MKALCNIGVAIDVMIAAFDHPAGEGRRGGAEARARVGTVPAQDAVSLCSGTVWILHHRRGRERLRERRETARERQRQRQTETADRHNDGIPRRKLSVLKKDVKAFENTCTK